MQVNVRLFATLRQIAGWRERTFEVGEESTLGELLTLITQVQPELNLTQRVTYAAINEEYATSQSILKAGDQVAIFPPVSGGRNA